MHSLLVYNLIVCPYIVKQLIHHGSVHLSLQISELFKAYHTDFETNPEDTAYRLNFGKQLPKIYIMSVEHIW